MGHRQITIFNGVLFDVPKHIVRIDILGSKTTHGWQVRYGKPWKMFSDHTSNGSGAAEALTKAREELLHRIKTLPAPSGVRKVTTKRKTSDLPPGISGPFKRRRKGKTSADIYLQVSLPVLGQGSLVKQVYIGNESTYSEERLKNSVEKAQALRRQFIGVFEQALTEKKRAEAVALDVVGRIGKSGQL